MSILLVNPPYAKKVYRSRQSPSVRPPLGLAYVAAGLEDDGFKVEILDANAEYLTLEETAKKIISSPAKYVGFTSVTATIPLVCEISSLVKTENSGKFIFVGGPHVTFMAEQTLKDCPAIDVAVRGEGEITAPLLIKALEKDGDLSEIKGITFRNGEKIIANPDREFIEDINTISFPARHLLPLHLYSPSPLESLGLKGKKYATLITARGCPNRCVFCASSHFWKRVRVRSPENVLAEVEFLVKQCGVGHINFLDDTLVLSKERVERICQLILEKGLNFKWSCYARVNHITPELVDLMEKTGCRFIQFGVESGNQEVLNKISKNITLEQVRKATKIVKKAGLKLMCDFMIGLPGDTEETVNQTIEFAKELNPDLAFFSITTPFPGTTLYEDYRKLDRLKEGYIWQNMSLHEKTDFSTPDLTSRELRDLYSKAHHSYYLRPAYFWQTIKWIIKNPHEVKNFYSLAKIQINRELRKILGYSINA